MKIENLLREEIQNEIEELGKLELGSGQYTATVDGVTKMMDRVIEMEKLDIEHQERIETRDEENQIKKDQLKEDRKFRYTNLIVPGICLLTQVAVNVWGVKYTTNFEKEDSVTTTAGRSNLNSLFKFKR